MLHIWKSLRTKEKEEKVSTDMTPESSTSSCGVDWKSPEDVHALPNTTHPMHDGTLHMASQIDSSRWFSLIGVSRPAAHRKKSSLLALAVKTFICVFGLPKCHQKGCRSFISQIIIFNHSFYVVGYVGMFSPASFLSKVEFGEQTVKNVDNLLGSGVAHVQLPVLPVWYWEHYGVESGVEFEGSWKMSVSTKQTIKLYRRAGGPFSRHSAK